MVNVQFDFRDSTGNEIYSKVIISPNTPIAYSSSIVTSDAVIVLEKGQAVTVPLAPNTYGIRLIGFNAETEFNISIPSLAEGTTVNAKDYIVSEIPSTNYNAASASYAQFAVSASYAPSSPVVSCSYAANAGNAYSLNSTGSVSISGSSTVIGNNVTLNGEVICYGGLFYDSGNKYIDPNNLYDVANGVIAITYNDDHFLNDKAGNPIVNFAGNGLPLQFYGEVDFQYGSITCTQGALTIFTDGNDLALDARTNSTLFLQQSGGTTNVGGSFVVNGSATVFMVEPASKITQFGDYGNEFYGNMLTVDGVNGTLDYSGNGGSELGFHSTAENGYKFGILTNTPAYPLDVNGVIHSSTNVSASGVIATTLMQLPYSSSAHALTPSAVTGSAYIKVAATNLLYVYNGTRWTSASLA